MRDSGIGRCRIKASPVGCAGALCFSHGVIDFEDYAFSAVLTEVLFILAANDRKAIHNEFRVVASDSVEVKAKGVEFTTHHKPAIVVPDEGRTGARQPFCE